jgi:DhnA family fructose-bisphosphate aldolase class Ia
MIRTRLGIMLFLIYSNCLKPSSDQTLFASVDQAFDMGAVAVGATV